MSVLFFIELLLLLKLEWIIWYWTCLFFQLCDVQQFRIICGEWQTKPNACTSLNCVIKFAMILKMVMHNIYISLVIIVALELLYTEYQLFYIWTEICKIYGWCSYTAVGVFVLGRMFQEAWGPHASRKQEEFNEYLEVQN